MYRPLATIVIYNEAASRVKANMWHAVQGHSEEFTNREVKNKLIITKQLVEMLVNMQTRSQVYHACEVINHERWNIQGDHMKGRKVNTGSETESHSVETIMIHNIGQQNKDRTRWWAAGLTVMPAKNEYRTRGQVMVNIDNNLSQHPTQEAGKMR